jgi:hypothetical protein
VAFGRATSASHMTFHVVSYSSTGSITIALAASDEVTNRRVRNHRAAELAVQRARYEADRAERAFTNVDPENRLVARSLESRWEAKLGPARRRRSGAGHRPGHQCTRA